MSLAISCLSVPDASLSAIRCRPADKADTLFRGVHNEHDAQTA